MTLPPGTRIGAYRLDQPIGQGSCATVYRANNVALSRVFALKLFSSTLNDVADFGERFLSEMSALSRLRHPNILALYDFGQTEHGVYVVSDYIDGGALAARASPPVSLEHVSRYLGPVAAALDYGHALGRLHLDITSFNVLIARDGRPLLADFRITALALEALGLPPPTVAPEQVIGQPLGPRADQFSLAAVAYTLLTGARPFAAGDPLNVTPPAAANPAISERTTRTLLQALARRPEDRFANAVAFVAALEFGQQHNMQPGASQDDVQTSGGRHSMSRAASPAPGKDIEHRSATAAPIAPAAEPEGTSRPTVAGRTSGGATRPAVPTWAYPIIGILVVAILTFTVAKFAVGGERMATPATTARIVSTPTQQAVLAPPAATTVATPLPGPAATLSLPIASPSVAPTAAPTLIAAATPTGSVDALAATFIGTINVGRPLCDLVAGDSGQRLYVTDDQDQQLLVVDLATKQETQHFDLNESACGFTVDQQRGVAWLPTWHRTSGNQYDSSKIQGVELATGIIHRFRAGHLPSGPFFDAGTRILYIGNTDEPSLIAVNTADGTVTDSIPAPVQVHRLAIARANGHAFLVSAAPGPLQVFDVGARKAVATVDVDKGASDVVADPTTGRLLVSSELSGQVVLVDPTTNQVVRTYRAGSHPRTLACDSVHDRCYVLNVDDRSVTTIQIDQSDTVTSAPLPGADELTGMSVASKTGQLFVVSKQQIYVLQGARR